MILIGTSGFSYEDWRGRWYPPDLPKAKMLEEYAGVFDALEINATYYTTPGERTAASMVERAGGRLTFAVKAPGKVTHERKLGTEIVEPYRRFLRPFEESGKLAAVLFQFPFAFQDRGPSWEYLERIREVFGDLPLVVEMRHSSWDHGESDARIGEMGLSRVTVDQPGLNGLSESESVHLTGPIAYFRFHGRNAAQWFDRQNPRDRYRYTYSEEELKPWVPRIRKASEKAETTLAFFNNHPDGGAAQNGEMLAEMLGVPLRGEGYRDLFT